MNYTSTPVNDSPVISLTAGAALSDARGRAVQFDTNGKIIFATDEGVPLGIATISNTLNIAVGEDVEVQVGAIGMIRAGAAIVPGNALTPDETGALIPAADDGSYMAIALQGGAAGAYIPALLVRGAVSKNTNNE